MADSKDIPSLTDQQAQQVLDSVLSCTPLLSEREAHGLAQTLFGVAGDAAMVARVGLAMAEKDGAWFKSITQDRERATVAAADLEGLQSCAQLLREVADILDAARTRAAIALCAYPDAETLMTESKRMAIFQRSQPVH